MLIRFTVSHFNSEAVVAINVALVSASKTCGALGSGFFSISTAFSSTLAQLAAVQSTSTSSTQSVLLPMVLNPLVLTSSALVSSALFPSSLISKTEASSAFSM